ncbi:hypothetical protein conserved [Leishmania donovani]|uniref:Uncharacterized protein n=3 Tax=Leishmania donovani species complex TaxID=38574 RepID=E9AGY2_LEIIN|nr:hypothetical protein, unknown function [Leishmania infantum JPCM5]XP_003860741.1 hypothetical protein, unknown function [Leishmania donovani]CAC9487379.1 hypothetical_protein_-_conserved [Leishmania infantum]AYU78695.1 hypothetical protein LdCL_220005200 [Leishmania donovani]TPP45405.1 hypothetical protein CGC21_32950 [Leishmania donovani]TPP54149.1 hypothetical protein CGC20_16805 [Leishmania donovani]CAJ1988699.1 hypothetical protein conserved [Leishmania donovani]|eukprot:XP_003392483.1 hypothetical protein, unknown function [Leishmania infantum JPCM5]
MSSTEPPAVPVKVVVDCKEVGVTIDLHSPPTASNFLAYNRVCSTLDSDYLMQPINEAQYDSETQACVDRLSNGPTSFYDHYVRKPTRKRGLAVGCESPMEHIGVSDDFLMPPTQRDLPAACVKGGIFSDPLTRRLATGRMPSRN